MVENTLINVLFPERETSKNSLQYEGWSIPLVELSVTSEYPRDAEPIGALCSKPSGYQDGQKSGSPGSEHWHLLSM